MNVLGRTNRTWPDTWWRLGGLAGRESISESLRSAPRPVLASGSPSVWANELRGAGCEWLVAGSASAESAPNEAEAAGRIMGEVCSAVSCSPDAEIAIWFLTVRRAWEEYQINGALAGLADAREEGLIKHIGIHIAGPAFAVAGLWRFHDAFELVLSSPGPDFAQVVATAMERRVGIVQDGGNPQGYGPVLMEAPLG